MLDALVSTIWTPIHKIYEEKCKIGPLTWATNGRGEGSAVGNHEKSTDLRLRIPPVCFFPRTKSDFSWSLNFLLHFHYDKIIVFERGHSENVPHSHKN